MMEPIDEMYFVDVYSNDRYSQHMSEHRCQLAGSVLDATVSIPGSKSITNRAVIMSALAGGTSLIKNILVAQDTQLMFNAVHDLEEGKKELILQQS